MSKLRENNKTVIGVGVKKSTSDLLTANCDEFIFYDDLVKKQKPKSRASRSSTKKPATRRKGKAAVKIDPKKQEAWDLVVETYEALLQERGEEDNIWGSMIKQTLKRRNPGFNESQYGFRSFGQLLEEAAEHGILELERDERSGGFIVKGVG